MIYIAETVSALADKITAHRMDCNTNGGYESEFSTYDEGWEELFLSYDHLRKKLGEERYNILIDMSKQAKAHYDQDKIFFGSRLMQDIGAFVQKKTAFSYPEELYRWPLLYSRE